MRPTMIARLAALLAVALLAACGGTQAAAPTTAPQGAATSAPPASVTEAPPAAAETPAEPTAASASIPSGKTPEGYNYLGDPNAPVTIQDYSDFY